MRLPFSLSHGAQNCKTVGLRSSESPDLSKFGARPTARGYLKMGEQVEAAG